MLINIGQYWTKRADGYSKVNKKELSTIQKVNGYMKLKIK